MKNRSIKASAIAGAFLLAAGFLPAHAQDALTPPPVTAAAQALPDASWTSEKFASFFREGAAVNSAELAVRLDQAKELVRSQPKLGGAAIQAARDVFATSKKRKTWVLATGFVAWVGQNVPSQRHASRETLELMMPAVQKLLDNKKTDIRRVGADLLAQAGRHPDLGLKALQEIRPLLKDESQATRCVALMNMTKLNDAAQNPRLARASFNSVVPMFRDLATLQQDLSVCIVENAGRIALDGGAGKAQLSRLMRHVAADETLPNEVRRTAASYYIIAGTPAPKN